MLVLIFCLLCAGCQRADAPRLTSDPQQVRNEILQYIPIGSDIGRAQELMEGYGFRCEMIRNGEWLKLSDIDYLYCDINKSESFLVSRRWQVAIIEDRGRVKDIQVTTGLTGP